MRANVSRCLYQLKVQQMKTILVLVIFCVFAVVKTQISIPFTPLSELRVKFSSVTTDLKLNIYQNVFSALKCAPNVTVSFVAKQNAYISWYTVEWVLVGATVFSKKVNIQEYLYTGQRYSYVQKIETFNCKYGGHPELAYKPGQYSFVFTFFDNNKRSQTIGKMRFQDKLNCTKMTTGCWAYTACDSMNSDCQGSDNLSVEQDIDLPLE